MRILIYVEGDWDKLFAERILKPLFERKSRNDIISIQKYREIPKANVTNVVKIFDNKGLWVFLADHDKHKSTCKLTLREELKKIYSLPSIQNICLAVREIEDWYSIGITPQAAERLAIPDWHEGKLLGKDFFKKHWNSEIDLRIEILKDFSKEEAMKCDSFRYFIEKYKLNF